MRKSLATLLTALIPFSCAMAETGGLDLNREVKPATAFTAQANAAVYDELDFSDKQEYAFATRGLIDAPETLELKDEDGRMIWSQDAFAFLNDYEKAPDSVNPSLWENTINNHVYGLFEVADGIYQVRGYDMANLTVVKGDTWGQIANNNGMTAAELEALNPGYDINRIHIGDALTLSNAVPYLTVKVTERQNYVEDVNYDVNYVSDSSMYQGDERVISKGSFGKADIVADVTYINGEEQERTVISSVTLSDPVAETRARGTKVRPTWYPTGSFRWPCSGRITSRFGYRNTGIRLEHHVRDHRGVERDTQVKIRRKVGE